MQIDLHIVLETLVAAVVGVLAWSLRGNWANIREGQQDIRMDVQSIRQDHRALHDRVTDHGKSIAVLEAQVDSLENRTRRD